MDNLPNVEKKVFRSHSLSKDAKLRAFRTLVMPVLLYGAEMWNVSKHDLQNLKTFQMRCLRDIIGFTLWDRMQNTTILEIDGELAVEDQLHQRRLQWFGHIWRMPAHRPQRQLLWCRPNGRKRPQGGAPLRWCNLISDDLKGITNWMNTIQDRTEWHAAIHQCQPRSISHVHSKRILPNVHGGHGEERRKCVCACVRACVRACMSVMCDLHCVVVSAVCVVCDLHYVVVSAVVCDVCF